MTDQQIRVLSQAVEHLKCYQELIETIPEEVLEKEKEALYYEFTMSNSRVDAQMNFLNELMVKYAKK